MKATTLFEAMRAFDPRPLDESNYDQLHADSVTAKRGSNLAKRLEIGLLPRVGEGCYKTYMVGTSGCGKSTEMVTLNRAVKHKVQMLVISADGLFDPTSFQPFDFLFLIASRIAEETYNLTGSTASQNLLEQLREWGSHITEKSSESRKSDLDFESGIEVKTPSLLSSVFSAFAKSRASLRFTSARSKDLILYNLNRIGDLIKLVNRILDECNRELLQANKLEWMVVADDFDRRDISPECLKNLVLNYGHVLRDLKVHLVLNVPRYLLSESQIPQFGVEFLADIPVYDKEHKVRPDAIESVMEVVEKRMSLGLFAEGTLAAAIVSSGGVFSTLFRILVTSFVNALEREQQIVRKEDMLGAIRRVRSDFRLRLAPSPYESPQVSPQEKADSLMEAYDTGMKVYVPKDRALRLIDLQLILMHNGTYWYSVHPLAVDYLADLNKPVAGGGSLPEYR